MNLNQILKLLVLALPVLVVGFAIFMGGFALAQAMQDRIGAAIYRNLAIACALVLAADVVLVVTILGLRAIEEPIEKQVEEE